MNRFIKQNRFLAMVLLVCVVAAVLLLGYVIVELVRYAKSTSETEELTAAIEKLNKAKVAPVKGNEEPIKQDTELYAKLVREMGPLFGQHLKTAVDAFLIKLDPPCNPEKRPEGEITLEMKKQLFIEEYREVVLSHKQLAEQSMSLDVLRNDYGKRWPEAVKAFREEAAKVLLDATLEEHAEDIALAALGIPRSMGAKKQNFVDFMTLNHEKLTKMLGARLNHEADNFGLDFINPGETYTTAEYAPVSEHVDILTDLINRISKSQITRFDGLIIGNVSAEGGNNTGNASPMMDPKMGGPAMDMGGGGEESNRFSSSFRDEDKFQVARYIFEVQGSLASIREVARLLDEAVADHRFYVIRAINIYHPVSEINAINTLLKVETVEEENVDGSGIAGLPSARRNADPMMAGVPGTPAPATALPARRPAADPLPLPTPRNARGRAQRGGGAMDPMVLPGRGAGMVDQEKLQEDIQRALERERQLEASLPPHERQGYADIKAGNTDSYQAVFDVDYIRLKIEPVK